MFLWILGPFSFIYVDIFSCGNSSRADMSGIVCGQRQGSRRWCDGFPPHRNDLAPPLSYLLCCSSCLTCLQCLLTLRGQSGHKCLCFICKLMTSPLWYAQHSFWYFLVYCARPTAESTWLNLSTNIQHHWWRPQSLNSIFTGSTPVLKRIYMRTFGFTPTWPSWANTPPDIFIYRKKDRKSVV